MDRAKASYSWLLVCLSVFGFAVSGALAQDTKIWRVNKASGDVSLIESGITREDIPAGTIVASGTTIRTGQTGRVLLLRGEESMLINPKTVVTISDTTSGGISTVVKQQSGSIEFEVEKKNVRHFQVETPYLTAVVKGTHFEVAVESRGAHVDVSRGSVEVQDLRSGQFALIQPGQSAKVAGEGPAGLELGGAGPLGPIQLGMSRQPTIVAAEETKAGGLSRIADASTPQSTDHPQRPAIQAPASSPASLKPGFDAMQSSMSKFEIKPPASIEDGLYLKLGIPAGVFLLVSCSAVLLRREKKEDKNKRPRT